jgi:hypothetical protein
MVDLGMREKVHFIFDEQLHASDRVQAVWSKIIEIIHDDLRPLIGGRPSHRNDKEVLPLQAADLLAWHVRRWYDEKQSGGNFQSPVLDVMKTMPQWGAIISGNYLDDILAEARGIGRLRQKISTFFADEKIRQQIREALTASAPLS